MSPPTYDQQNVTVFWEFDTTHISDATSRISIHTVIHNLRAAILPFGPIKAFRAYWDFAGEARLPNIRNDLSSLSSSGLTLINCPGNGRKDSAVKIMLVDLIAQAWDTSPPHTFVVITADRDVAYAISTLRMRGYRVVVVSPRATHPDLSAQASVKLELTQAILGLSQDSGGVEDKAPNPIEPSTASGLGQHSGPYKSRTQSTVNNNQSERFKHHEATFELRDLPLSPTHARHKSLFDVFGDIEDLPATSGVPRGSFGLGFGNGPLFPRSQSRAEAQSRSRAGSAPPPNIFSTGALPAYADFGENGTSTRLSSKGKGREFQPEDIAPYSPSGPLSHIPYSGSIFEPFGEKQPPFQTAFSSSRSKPLTQSSSISSTSSISKGSHFSFVQHPEPLTAPTSADTFPSTYSQPPLQKEVEVNVPTTKSPLLPSGKDVEARTKPPKTEIATPAAPLSSSINETVKNKTTQTPTAPQVKTSVIAEKIATPVIVIPVSSATPPATAPRKQVDIPVFPQGIPKPVVAGPSKLTAPVPKPAPKPTFPPTFELLVDVLRKNGGSMNKISVRDALLRSTSSPYKKSGFKNLNTMISAALNAGIIMVGYQDSGEAMYALKDNSSTRS